MRDKVLILSDEIKQIHEQYLGQVGPGGRKVWPRAIKERVLELDRLVGSTKKTAELSGLSIDTIYLWRSQAKLAGFKALSVVENKTPSVTVTVTKPEQLKDFQELKSVTVTVTTPKGYKIENLPANLAVEFLLKVKL